MANLYLLTQSSVSGYDTFDSCVVCANNEDEAKEITPNGFCFNDWATSPEQVVAKFIGVAADDIELSSMVIASYNAG